MCVPIHREVGKGVRKDQIDLGSAWSLSSASWASHGIDAFAVAYLNFVQKILSKTLQRLLRYCSACLDCVNSSFNKDPF